MPSVEERVCLLARARSGVDIAVEWPKDGRRERGERTRRRAIDALLALAAEGALRPTGLQVAQRAGVALRTVYHHFENVETLQLAALERQLDRHKEFIAPIDDDLLLADRVARVGRQRRQFYEETLPIRRALQFGEQTSERFVVALQPSNAALRDQLAQTFAPEIAENQSGRLLFDALGAAASWENWSYLRIGLGRTPIGAERTVTYLMGSLLGLPQ